MRHSLQLAAALLFAGIAATAQNLNPVVEVTNTYEQAATGIEKPDQVITVPDSLLRFNFDMDYQMRSTPYKGAYEFNPYLVELKPAPRSLGEGTLSVRLGAGYGFHPELDAVWSPLKKDNFRLNLYARHRGYFGPYRSVSLSDDGTFRGSRETLYNGADALTSAGANTLLNWHSGTWTGDLHYSNLYAADSQTRNSHHLLSLQTRVQSAPRNRVYYNAGVRGNYLIRDDGLKGGQLNADGGIGFNRRHSQARLDLFGEAVFLEAGQAGQAGVIPRYVFRMGDLRLNLGLKLAFTFRSREDFYPNRGGYVFPDVQVDYRVVPEDFIVYASATGGNKVQGYMPLLRENHFLPSFAQDGYDMEVEHVNVAAGVRGNIARRFHYDAKVGYAYRTNAVLWGFLADVPDDGAYCCWMGLADYGLFYADFAGGWKSEHLDVDTHLLYRSTSLVSDCLLAPAAFTAQAKVLYNWGGRIKLGADVDAATERATSPETEGVAIRRLPGYADLGLYAEYGFTRKLALWLRVGNLLNQDVQRTPFHAERGIWFSVGAQYHF